MILYPEDLLETLEFNRIRDLTADRCMGLPGAALARSLRPVSDMKSVVGRLAEVAEFSKTIHMSTTIPFGPYEDIRPGFRYLEIIDYVLDASDLLQYRNVLNIHQGIHRWFDGEMVEAFSVLGALVEALPFEEEPLVALNRVFDEKGEVREDASPALKQIRAAIVRCHIDLEKQFGALIQEYRKQGWLSESGESIRNGRRVLIVPSEHKRKIKGIIHDESGSGRTVFLEPERMVALNNDLFELESDERQEIYRILKALCGQLRPYLDYFKELMRWIVRWDLIRAKALVSLLYQGNAPEISESPEFLLRGARHPLLWLKNQETGKAVVPFDLTLNRKQRILLLSGPNAGGKSITMKTVMLLQIMVQCGYLAPARPGSKFTIFHRFFADIGDQQSLEDDLSTYSSRLRNLRFFLEKADRRTLIALDEFGSGTDPKIGGSIAEAALKSLNRRQVMGVVTTHYSNLKLFAFKQEGLVNGAMVFDQELLKPAYELQVGKPGSSYAFEIAVASGLPDDVIDYARSKGEDNGRAMEKLLGDLQQKQRQVEEQMRTTQEKEKKLDQLIRSYEGLFKELEYQRKKHKVDVKELALQQKSKETQEVEHILRELKEERRLEKVEERKEVLRQEQERLRQQVAEVRQEVSALAPPSGGLAPASLSKGDFVRVRGGGAIGEVLELTRSKAKIVIGELTMLVALHDLEWVSEPLDLRRNRSVQLNKGMEGVATKLDIRGFTKEDALRVLELFLDQALLNASRSVSVLHGKGSGVLRKAVIEKAREYKDIRAIEPADPKEGGEGVTILRFA